jgi:hypothetical protein
MRELKQLSALSAKRLVELAGGAGAQRVTERMRDACGRGVGGASCASGGGDTHDQRQRCQAQV